jgi:hypothetical protein
MFAETLCCAIDSGTRQRLSVQQEKLATLDRCSLTLKFRLSSLPRTVEASHSPIAVQVSAPLPDFPSVIVSLRKECNTSALSRERSYSIGYWMMQPCMVSMIGQFWGFLQFPEILANVVPIPSGLPFLEFPP